MEELVYKIEIFYEGNASSYDEMQSNDSSETY